MAAMAWNCGLAALRTSLEVACFSEPEPRRALAKSKCIYLQLETGCGHDWVFN